MIRAMLSRISAAVLPLWGKLPIPNWLRWTLIWRTNQKFLVGVGSIIFNERGEVLLCHHTYRKLYPWGLPGGWLEKHEGLEQAAEREVLEETGYRVRALQPLWAGCDAKTAGVHLIFLARLEGGEFRPCAEVSEARFFPVDALPRLMPGHQELIRQARAAAAEDRE